MAAVRVPGGGRARVAGCVVLACRSRVGAVAVVVVVGLVGAWAATGATGGTRTPMPHLFYLPIVLAAVRFSWAGTLGTALAAGLLAGPGLPADAASGTPQPFELWFLRLLIFTAIAVLVHWLARNPGGAVLDRLDDRLLSSRLVAGIEAGHLEVVYQPVFDNRTGRVAAVEALARWHDPRCGLVGPAEFIPAAERTGAVQVLDRHVLRVAVGQAREWQRAGVPTRVSVNVSATRFAEHDLVDDVRQVLADSGLPASLLQLEITESAIIDDVPAARVQVDQLRSLGVRVAIDDFGSGRSSLAYLSQFSLDVVKIDRELLAGFPARAGSERLLAGLVGLFRALDLEVVAEGVESAEQYLALRMLGCSLVQGYHPGRPAPAGQVTALLQDRRNQVSPRPEVSFLRQSRHGVVGD